MTDDERDADATNAGLAGVLNGDSVTLVTSNAAGYFGTRMWGRQPVTVTGLVLAGRGGQLHAGQSDELTARSRRQD